MPRYKPVISGDYGFPLNIDTELSDLSGLTLKMIFIDPDGTEIANTRTASDGGAGPVGQLMTYTTLQADAGSPDYLFVKVGHWKVIGQVSIAGTRLQHSSPPLIVPVVNKGE